MQALERSLRSKLEAAVKRARILAEAGARAALDELGITDSGAPPHLNQARRELRVNLRAHGRQLGDRLDASSVQSMDRLVEEVAYEHWHRMLFARFLAENQLLMYPDPSGPVPVSLEECNELAADEGAPNGWELAARYAAQMLPQIFRVDSPVFAIKLPANQQVPLEALLAELPAEVFTASDSLGWVYQFWQADNKDRINRAEVKIGARELPAVTQLFTEPYMVAFLLDNALGAWWAVRRLSEDDLRHAPDEASLRRKASLPGLPLTYLRFVRETGADGIERWAPAAGTFPGWPQHLSELKCLDPCCGSGHFLVSLLLMLTPLRMEMEGLDARAAVDAVLRDNLHGLELDPRCVEIAAFALALTAWIYPEAGGYRRLPEIQVACSGLSVSVAKEEWKALAREGGLGGKNLAIAMDWLHDTFRDAPVLGSLIDPSRSDAAKIVAWDELSAALQRALAVESTTEQHEVAVVAQGLAKAATLLSQRYSWVVTNVPYLGRGNQDERLFDFSARHYPEGKSDLATVFLDRCLAFCRTGGSTSLVLPQNWLFLTSYKALRERLLSREIWNIVSRLGAGAFETVTGEVVKAILVTLTRGSGEPTNHDLFSSMPKTHTIRSVDVADIKLASEKSMGLLSQEVRSLSQPGQLLNPDARLLFGNGSNLPLLKDFADGVHGLGTKDSLMFVRLFWEQDRLSEDWEFMQSAGSACQHWGGMESIVWWQGESGELHRRARVGMAILAGGSAHNKPGVLVSQVSTLSACLYHQRLFEKNAAVVSPNTGDMLPAIWSYCASDVFRKAVRELDQKLAVTNSTLVKVPFDVGLWSLEASARYPNGLPQPYADEPTQWIFHGHPCGSVIWDEAAKWTCHGPLRVEANVLQIAVVRLLGYRWPAELDPDMELAAEQREWVNRCAALAPLADEDGIVCIPPVRGEPSADSRLRDLLAAAYGSEWSSGIEARLLACAEFTGKSLEAWLRDGFFAQHCALFQHRPFIWQVWDGLHDGFSVLLNYHQLDTKRLETLIYTYLGDWISRQKLDIAAGVDGAQEKLAAAEALKKRLELILEGEQPYDIFVRWKSLAEQPIGWDPDLNDGVRLNIRPFMSVPDIRKKGAGVLRDKPNIHWKKDRGTDVESAPWYHLGPAYGGKEGDRINEHHLTLAEKHAARNG